MDKPVRRPLLAGRSTCWRSGHMHPARMKLLTLLAALVLAQPAGDPSFAPSGIFLFHTNAQVDEEPVCSELWEFLPGGVLLVESGAERVEKQYRVESDQDGVWIVSRVVSTNGAPDCMGNANSRPSRDEQRTYVVPMNDGRVMTCPPPARVEGAPFVSGCYGWLVPADQVG